jgi:transglutaminase-like putative cysteine protease
MRYKITHNTNYEYKEVVPLCYSNATIIPRNTGFQRLERSNIEINPLPTYFHQRKDFYGNNVIFFTLEKNFDTLDINISSEVDTDLSSFNVDSIKDVTWNESVAVVQEIMSPGMMDARQFIFESPLIKLEGEINEFARLSFSENTPLLECVLNLMWRIYSDFEYVAEITNIYTPISHVLKSKKGVCQDFAQLAIGCLRSMGIPARYVSGYIENPIPEDKDTKGADASHAWFSVYFPGQGWTDFDPTNNKFPCDQHVTIGWGRDYADVSPLRGIVYGASDHELSVTVNVVRMSNY